MTARRTLSYFSRLSSPSIGSVSSEQWRMWWTNYQLVTQLGRNPLLQVNWTKWKLLHNLFLRKCNSMKSDRETCFKNTSNDQKNCQKTKKLSKLCSEASLRSVEIGQFFYVFPSLRGKENQSFCENTRCLEIKKEQIPWDRSKTMCDFILCRT